MTLSKLQKHVLVNYPIDPIRFSANENECWGYIDLHNHALAKAEAKRNAHAIRQEAEDFANSISEKFQVKKAVLLEQLSYAKYFPERYDLKKLERESKIYLGDEEAVTQETINRAKDTPIENLIPVQRKGNISCPLHEDKNPSFQIKKNNTWTCYSCGEYGDVIDLYQKLNNVSFIEAVKALT